MPKATRVYSTPPTNTSAIDPTRRRFLTVAAGSSIASVGALTVAAMPATAPGSGACAADPAFALIAEKLAADVAHCEAIDAQDEAERDEWTRPPGPQLGGISFTYGGTVWLSNWRIPR